MYVAGEAMRPEQFTSGTDSKCFKILEEQGFSVVEKNHPIRSEADLKGIHLEHYLVAKSLTGSFSRSDFIARYCEMYPARNEGSYLVSDYAYNNEPKRSDAAKIEHLAIKLRAHRTKRSCNLAAQ
jgi:hypothetical protein